MVVENHHSPAQSGAEHGLLIFLGGTLNWAKSQSTQKLGGQIRHNLKNPRGAIHFRVKGVILSATIMAPKK